MQPATPSANFQLAVPHLLASITPSFAALHATRVRLLYPSDPLFSGTHCAQCGTPLIANDSQTRSVRKKRRKSSGGDAVGIRALRRSCRTCGHEEDVLLGVNRAPAFPMPRDRARREPSTNKPPRASSVASHSPAEMSSSKPESARPRASEPIVSSSTPGSSRPSSVTPTRSMSIPSSAPSPRPPTHAVPIAQDQTKIKARQKKRSGLQSMLARNRERQEQEKKREGCQGAGLSAFLQGL
ncbi:hypothetical protein BD309DRAFT_968167 [Dichomitus squalens]|uniref:Uncharacterized protein n=1 Tax=Dichomitus squalens TaxID=114155 RepID=A0A4Q9NG78_9APHY|nr:hypothetical protein BD309DRAFT_968167 [Dichomitus squalens]TBU63911.1 hypothetical protein BD310DRAFT_839944 [Dichomitus squalens]